MRKKIEWQWEKLDEATFRAKVIGGWLVLHVKTFVISGGKSYSQAQSESMVFVADRDHEWQNIAPMVDTPPVEKPNKAADFAP